MSIPYLLETNVAISAVTRACFLTSSVFQSIKASSSSSVVTKSDASPVTVADYASQALVNTILRNTFPNDPVVGEESASELREGTGEKWQNMRDTITSLANDALGRSVEESIGEKSEWGIGKNAKQTTDALLNAIDRGSYEGGSTGRMWTLDPIDGTKGFLRGGQYAVCLAFIVDSEIQVGIIGCPNLPFGPGSTLNGFAHLGEGAEVKPGEGSIFVAVKGHGARQYPFPPDSSVTPVQLSIPQSPSPPLRLLESVEAAHSSHGFNSLVASSLGMTSSSLRMDSQAKYCALAAQSPSDSSSPGSGGDVYLRLPVAGRGYQEKIWDHASGYLLVHEAGGIVSDSYGGNLNFGLGRTLGENKGVVAAGQSIHARVIEAIKQAREAEKAQEETASKI